MGFECVDNNLLGLINELHAFFVKYYSAFISAGKALGALMVVFVVAGEAYKVMVKHQAFDVLAILRPIAFALVLSNWVAFVTAVGAIPRLMENYSKSIFEKEHMSIIHDRETRTKVAEEVLEKTKEAEAAAKVAEQQITDGSTFDKITSMGLDMLETIKEQIASFGTVFQAKANQWLEGWVMKIGELIWQICVVFHKRNICRNSYCNWSDNFWIIRIAGMERCVDSMGGEICKCFAIWIYRFFCISCCFTVGEVWCAYGY